MAHSHLQAVIFDLDGTAVPNGFEGRPTPRLLQVLRRAAPQLRLCAATGRSWEVAHELITALALTDPCIISGGTEIIDPVTHELLWQALIEPASAAAVAEVMARHDYGTVYIRGLESTYHLRDFEPQGINAMYFLGVTTADEAAVRAQLSGIPHITVSKALSWRRPEGLDLHITADTATKEHAVRELATMIGVPTSHMAGVGDGHNDIHLLNAVGHRVAMGNAVPELKAAADEVIGSIDEDGLAVYIEGLL